MAAKTVWGAVLIVLGVVAVISGFQQLAEISQYDKIMQITQRQLGAYQSLLKDDLNYYRETSRDAKTGGVIKMVVGVGFAIWGTFLLQDGQRKKKENEYPPLPKSVYDWKLMSDDEVPEFTRPSKPPRPLVTPIYSDPNRPDISKARCESCSKEFTYPTSKAGSSVSCPQCRIGFELP